MPRARSLDAAEAADVLTDYAGRHARAAGILGRRLYGSSFSAEQLAAATAVVGLRPRAGG